MMKVETRENGVSPDRVDRNEFSSYLELVAAKRKRNQEWLEQSGLLNVATLRDVKQKSSSSPEKKGIVADNKKNTIKEVSRRKSSRLAGFKATDMYVEEERGGKFQIGGASPNDVKESPETIHQKLSLTYKNRLNDGEDISLAQAVMLCDKKWSTDTSVSDAEILFSEYLEPLVSRSPPKVHATSLASQKRKKIKDISPYNISNLDAVEVAKVTPDRIYSVACHPSPESLIVVAGDKTGHIGLWNVDGQAKDSSGTFSLFHVHSSPVSCLEWVGSGSGLLSASYDGTIRWMDVETKTFSQLFATFDSSQQFNTSLGFGMEDGIRSWIQFCCLDTRFGSEKCFFLSNSSGNAYHVDLREKGIVTFHEHLSEKKINTLSLHPDGNLLASAGLDCTVKIWDIRMFGDSRSNRSKNKSPKHVSEHVSSKSINSAFFSPSGSTLLSTTMANTLDIFENPHLSDGVLSPAKRVSHDNHTGRWLSTFMARWHPTEDMFVVGSMRQPRSVEIFQSDGALLRRVEGEALTSVASRCCFHPRSDKVIAIGGNSSGRVIVVR